MKKTKTKLGAAILRILLSVVLIFLLFYTMLPAINMRDRNFLIFLIISIVVVLMVNLPNYVKMFFESISQGSETIVGHNPITAKRKRYCENFKTTQDRFCGNCSIDFVDGDCNSDWTAFL